MFRVLILRCANWILRHLAVQVAIALTPGVLGMLTVAVEVTLTLPPITLVLVPAVGWSATFLLLILWYRNHSQRRTQRSLEVGRALWTSSRILSELQSRRNKPVTDSEIRDLITELL